jgi:predicted lipoprotein with Yx(FWY)xxD motif
LNGSRVWVVPIVVVALAAMTSLVALAADPTVGTFTSATLGTYLTAANGKPLYTFSGDTAGVSNVTGQLAVVWPPARATAPLTLPAGVGGTLSLITRSDGTQQLAYNSQPLYTFANDPTPGAGGTPTVTGQGGAGGRFFVAVAQMTGATATASPVATAAATASATVTASPTALPVTGEPGLPLGPALVLGGMAIALGYLFRKRLPDR